MKNFNWKPVQGNPNAIEAQASCKLLSVSSQPRELNNEKRTKYYIGTAALEVTPGNTRNISCMIFENNYIRDGKVAMEVGEEYLTTLQVNKGDNNVYARMSHLQGAGILTTDSFGVTTDELFEAVEAQQTISESV